MTNCFKRCGILLKLKISISAAFIGNSWPTNLNKNLDLEENVIFFTQK
jgi:hypothetical protein